MTRHADPARAGRFVEERTEPAGGIPVALYHQFPAGLEVVERGAAEVVDQRRLVTPWPAELNFDSCAA